MKATDFAGMTPEEITQWKLNALHDLVDDLRESGFGPCPTCGSGEEREVNGANLVDKMGEWFLVLYGRV